MNIGANISFLSRRDHCTIGIKNRSLQTNALFAVSILESPDLVE